MTATYSFDSSGFIDPFRRHYPPDLFPAFWEALATRIETGAIVASQVVRDEIEQKDDDLLAWVKRRSNLFVPMDEPQQDRLVEILTRFPTWVDPASSKCSASSRQAARATDSMTRSKELYRDVGPLPGCIQDRLTQHLELGDRDHFVDR